MSVIRCFEGAAPGTPPAGVVTLYAKTDKRWYFKGDDGVEYPLKSVGAGTGDLLADGSIPLTADWDVGAFVITGLRFVSDVVTGTAPFTVASTTVVPNLNVDQVDGCDVIDEDLMTSDSDAHVPTQQSVKAYVDTEVSNAVAGGVTYKGGYNASTNTPDLDTAPSGVLTGDMYTVTADGTFFTIAVVTGDVLIAEIDSASVEADWTIVEKNMIGDPVYKALFDANTILAADTDDTPAALTVAEDTLVGRLSGGNIDALTVSEAQTLLGVDDLVSAKNKVVTGTTYTILAADNGYNLIFTNAAAIAVSGLEAQATDFQCTVIQAAAGVPTVTPTTDTINGAGTGVAPDAQWKGMYLTQYQAAAWLALF